ncbi:MAG: hypothetical protein KAQ89_00200 [Planctomycetes bacterium]|nr:hypothetical protein [Planctomycetota bacterium]
MTNITDEQIEVSINLRKIPMDVGEIIGGPLGVTSTIYSRKLLKEWIFNQIPDVECDVSVVISGPMSNCIALQIGKWLGESKAKVIYQSFSAFKLEMI